MPHKGPGTRTSRTQALAIGTAPAGFEGGVEFCSQCGMPGTNHGHYKDSSDAARPMKGPVPVQSAPFKVGGTGE